MPAKREVIDLLNAYDQEYVDSWKDESNSRERLGDYEFALELMDFPEGGIHVDLGSGLGHLIANLKHRRPDARVFGIESNIQMAATAYHLFQSQGIPLDVVATPKLVDTAALPATRYPVPDSLNPPERLNPARPVQMIVDDIRSLEILKAILGDRQIDSGSFTYPGASKRDVFVSLKSQKDLRTAVQDQSVLRDRTLEHIAGVREAAYDFFSQRMKTGSTLVLAERMGNELPEDEESVKAFIAGQTFLTLGPSARYWSIDPDKIGYRSFSTQGHSDGLGWIHAPSRTADYASTRSGHIVILGATRNELPYSPSK